MIGAAAACMIGVAFGFMIAAVFNGETYDKGFDNGWRQRGIFDKHEEQNTTKGVSSDIVFDCHIEEGVPEHVKDWWKESDLVRRQAVIKEMERIMRDHPLEGYEDECLLIEAMKSLPSEGRTNGKWIVHDHGVTCWYKCNQCGEAGDKEDKYCKHCGAKMEVQSE